MTTPDPRSIEEALNNATRAVAREFGALLSTGVSERALTHRLAVQLEFRSKDCEYNRNTRRGKVIGAGHVLPDVVVHRRGTTANLLAVEAKRRAMRVDDRRS
jgi:hypothetical protein